MLLLLLASEKTVGELAKQVGVSPSSASQHLATLRSVKLVDARRDANRLYYRIYSANVREFVLQLMSMNFNETMLTD